MSRRLRVQVPHSVFFVEFTLDGYFIFFGTYYNNMTDLVARSLTINQYESDIKWSKVYKSESIRLGRYGVSFSHKLKGITASVLTVDSYTIGTDTVTVKLTTGSSVYAGMALSSRNLSDPDDGDDVVRRVVQGVTRMTLSKDTLVIDDIEIDMTSRVGQVMHIYAANVNQETVGCAIHGAYSAKLSINNSGALEISTEEPVSSSQQSVTILDGGTFINNITTVDGSGITVKSNTEAVTNPIATDDSSKGYAASSLWVENKTSPWICVDATEGAAVWKSTQGGGTFGGGVGEIQVIGGVDFSDDSVVLTDGDGKFVTEAKGTAFNKTMAANSHNPVVSDGNHVSTTVAGDHTHPAHSIPLSQLSDAVAVYAQGNDNLAKMDASNKIFDVDLLPKLVNYQSDCDADQNSPDMNTVVGANGDYFFVTVAGSTAVDGNDSWDVGDIIRFYDGVWIKVPKDTIPDGFQGIWNAASNSPPLTDGTGTLDDWYIVWVDGDTNLGGNTAWKKGDWVQYNGTVWTHINNNMNAANYSGMWDADTNTPDLTVASPVAGEWLVVSVAGTTTLGAFSVWNVGDLVVWNGDVLRWDRIDNTSVTSVNGETGGVVLGPADVGLSNVQNTVVHAEAGPPVLGQVTGQDTGMVWIEKSNLEIYTLVNSLWVRLTNPTIPSVPSISMEGYDTKGVAAYIRKISGIDKNVKPVGGSVAKPVTVNSMFWGCVYSPTEDVVYFVPGYTTGLGANWGKLNSSGAYESYPHGSSTVGNYVNAYKGGSHNVKHNRIYFAPGAIAPNSVWHYINCDNGTVVDYSATGTAQVPCHGSTYSTTSDVTIFCPSNSVSSLPFIDPDGNVGEYTVSMISSAFYNGGVWDPVNNRTWLIPGDSKTSADDWTYIECTNPPTLAIVSHTTTSTSKYWGGAYCPTTQRIYFAPYGTQSGTTWHYVDCKTNEVKEFVHGTTLVTNSYAGAVYVPTLDRIYFVPHKEYVESTTPLHYIDCATPLGVGHVKTYMVDLGTHTGDAWTNSMYVGGVYHPKLNRLVFAPYGQGIVNVTHHMDFEITSDPAWWLSASPMFNYT
jgi:hypothetical protein